jgi:N-succinyldiaminopimelate aminotransferase
MNQNIAKLQPYPFEKLSALKAGINPPANLKPISLSIGEPQHQAPSFVAVEVTASLAGLSRYPTIAGSLELRESIKTWLCNRFKLKSGSLDIERHILPVNGTREALFAFAQAVVAAGAESLVLMPNPFYQIYEGAAILAGAAPWFMNISAEAGYLPDFNAVPEQAWQRCKLIYICSPGNPTGTVLGMAQLKQLIELSDRFDFVIASDECYSEIYLDENAPPVGLLEAAAALGRDDYRNCVCFHSLSKRSNLPGMRSGFVAGDATILERFRLYRTYHGCSMSPPYQAASIKAWSDENHVRANRDLYRKKFDAVLTILSPVMKVYRPDASFYLWPETEIDDAKFARELYRLYNLTVLPGSYLSRATGSFNPGQNRIRLALVATLDECVEAAERIRDFVQSTRGARND